MCDAMDVVNDLARSGLFRVRDLKRRGLSANWMPFFQTLFRYVHHGHGVWSHYLFKPTRYEILQVRFPRAVFWGPSALWLLGESDREPEALWIAIGNSARPPRTLDPSTVIIRTRRVNDDVLAVRPERRPITLRVYSAERAHADLRSRSARETRSSLQP
jgi:hypothetical protein